MTSTFFTIAAVERETGLSKDVLRVWERRYGFPAPTRDLNGERCYPLEQVERLRLMKRLMDQGYRPGYLASLATAELHALPPRRAHIPAANDGKADDAAVEQLLATVQHQPGAFQQAMQRQLARQGLARFVEHVAAPLSSAVGKRWADGKLAIFDEHFYTEETQRVLRQAIGALPGSRHPPSILLTTLPGESHGLGLLMAEALLALDGAACTSLGTETPLLDIARAAYLHRSDVVALSFSAAYPRRQLAAALRQLRQALPDATALWAGGAGVNGLDAIDGVCLTPTLDDGRACLMRWRAERNILATG
jgi:DNA-binding transcriptional MerR regulator/methylmalonyl-CoA mutase cobalamin-binding subunit